MTPTPKDEGMASQSLGAPSAQGRPMTGAEIAKAGDFLLKYRIRQVLRAGGETPETDAIFAELARRYAPIYTHIRY